MYKNEAKRFFCFTINNPTPKCYQQCADLYLDDHVRYLCYGEEHFDTEGKTPHLQGYLEFNKDPSCFTWVRKRIPRARFAEKYKYSTRTQARDYCFKECENPVEFGKWKADRQGQRNDLICIKRKIDEGYTPLEIADEHFVTWTRCHRAFRRYRELLVSKGSTFSRALKRGWKTKVIVYWGTSGTGKTSAVYEMSPYPNPMEFKNGFWSPYNGEEDVLWDDFNPDQMDRETFLKMTDRYPYQLRQMGCWTPWVPKRLFITSNYDPTFWYGRRDEAVQRRIDVAERRN